MTQTDLHSPTCTASILPLLRPTTGPHIDLQASNVWTRPHFGLLDSTFKAGVRNVEIKVM